MASHGDRSGPDSLFVLTACSSTLAVVPGTSPCYPPLPSCALTLPRNCCNFRVSTARHPHGCALASPSGTVALRRLPHEPLKNHIHSRLSSSISLPPHVPSVQPQTPTRGPRKREGVHPTVRAEVQVYIGSRIRCHLQAAGRHGEPGCGHPAQVSQFLCLCVCGVLDRIVK